MADDTDWVADVRRWYFSSVRPNLVEQRPGELDEASTGDVGYEAAQPALQAKHWPDAALVETRSS